MVVGLKEEVVLAYTILVDDLPQVCTVHLSTQLRQKGIRHRVIIILHTGGQLRVIFTDFLRCQHKVQLCAVLLAGFLQRQK